jgi:RNA polymerase sigma-70 factor (ECF subfamily)
MKLVEGGRQEEQRALEPVLEPLTLEAVFRRHARDVYRMASRMLGPGASSADVEDVTQQVFIVAGRTLTRYDGRSKLTTWLYGIASRVVMTHLRGWRRRRRLIAALELSPKDSTLRRNPETTASDREELVEVWRSLMRISLKKRMVYVLFEIEGLSGPEIASALEIPEATVWTRLYHARRELMQRLGRTPTERP